MSSHFLVMPWWLLQLSHSTVAHEPYLLGVNCLSQPDSPTHGRDGKNILDSVNEVLLGS